MQRVEQKRWLVFWVVLCSVCLCIGLVHGADLVNLQAWVTYALMDGGAPAAPLADGSMVVIIGSGDSTIGPMQSYGATSYIAKSVTGDDVIIGVVDINSADLGSNGTFYSGDFFFDPDEVSYMYIRFFDAADPVLGFTNWGQSDITSAAHYAGGVLEMDFSPDVTHIYSADSNDHFVVIPEPSTGHLVLLLGGLACGIRAAMNKDEKGQRGSCS